MRPRGTSRIAIAAGLCLFAAVPAARAQARPQVRRDSVVTITPGEEYEAGAFRRTLFGSGWRDLWVTPVTVPIFDPATYAGGLKFDKRGGGKQTKTVHLV